MNIYIKSNYDICQNAREIKASKVFVHDFLTKFMNTFNTGHSAWGLSKPMFHLIWQLQCLTGDTLNCDEAAVTGTSNS